jgi:hypothetical protein
MNSTIFSTLGGALTGSSISMLLLLAKATLILLVALGITLTMQRASAGARHLVWLVTLAGPHGLGSDPDQSSATGAKVRLEREVAHKRDFTTARGKDV